MLPRYDVTAGVGVGVGVEPITVTSFKWMAAGLVVGLCFLPVIFVLWLIVAAMFAALFNGVMSTFHH